MGNLVGLVPCGAIGGLTAMAVLWAGFAVVLGVELGTGWCGDDVAAGFVGVFGDGPAVCVE